MPRRLPIIDKNPVPSPGDPFTLVSWVCSRCDHRWLRFTTDPTHCPKCDPDGEPSFFERLHDPTDFLGPNWVWRAERGHAGSWVHVDELYITDRSHIDELRTLASLCPVVSENNGVRVTEVVRRELLRQRAEIALLREQFSAWGKQIT